MMILSSICIAFVVTLHHRIMAHSVKVPLMLWSNDDQLLSNSLQYRSSIEDFDPEEINEAFSIKPSKVAFLQDQINLEQFSQAKLPYISKLFDENRAILFPYSHYDPNFYSDFDQVIILQGDDIAQNENALQQYTNVSSQTKPIVYILTGKSNDYGKKVAISRRKRQANEDVNVLQYPQENPCVYFYTKRIELRFKSNEKYQFTDGITFTGECLNISAEDNKKKSKKFANWIELKMQDAKSKKAFTVRMHFRWNSIMWEVSSLALNSDNSDYSTLNLADTIGTGFSFSCSSKLYRLYLNNNRSLEYADLIFDRFQMQPFVDPKSENIFEESYDCAVWFTLPIFSSLIIILLLVLILFIGIRALISIETPDRFENPKSKGLIITGADE
ncbi:hypothetical protein SSS_10268 [Sarcoptes scabiei]|uniref:V-type proton ATPase subunit S1-like protein n=2 Tax=Sarcoptes scabiei TaxID=52283 RepID=A0A834R880_SARSC|nr:hypothetical protein SSS_10268 [Sarcoptes scabiei]